MIHGNEMKKSTYTVSKKKERRQRPKVIGGNTKNILSSEIKNFFKNKGSIVSWAHGNMQSGDYGSITWGQIQCPH